MSQISPIVVKNPEDNWYVIIPSSLKERFLNRGWVDCPDTRVTDALLANNRRLPVDDQYFTSGAETSIEEVATKSPEDVSKEEEQPKETPTEETTKEMRFSSGA